MLGSKPESRRKRLLSELPQPNDTSYPTSKRQKLSYPSEPPASFWDNLSTIWLTKRALRELNRRNTEVAAVPSRTPHRRRACQCKIALYNSTDYLRACKPRILKNIKLFARQGGPDLSDLRNVCIASYLLHYAKADDALVPCCRAYPSFRSRDTFEPEFPEPAIE
jgi:hypothetical protein